MAKNKPKKEMPKVNPELEGFDIHIDSFGEIKSTYDIDKINEFLNRHVDDKKLREKTEEEELDLKKKKKGADEEE